MGVNSRGQTSTRAEHQPQKLTPLLPVSDIPDRYFPVVRISDEERTALELLGMERAKTSPGSIEAHVRGIMGEYAVAELFSVDIDSNIYDGGDPGFDLCVNGKLVDVKTANQRQNNPSLLVDATQDLFADYYVLVQELSRCSYRVFGYASVEVVAAARIVSFPPESPVHDVVPSSEVRVVEQHQIEPLVSLTYF